MAEATLPSDPEKTGNVWCEACQQSLPAGRAPAHLLSKKHQQSLEPREPKAARAGRARAPAPTEAETADAEDLLAGEPKAARAKRIKKAATPSGLMPDPGKTGNYWCGICEVSLTPTKAADHAATARHQERAAKTLSTAMRTRRADGK